MSIGKLDGGTTESHGETRGQRLHLQHRSGKTHNGRRVGAHGIQHHLINGGDFRLDTPTHKTHLCRTICRSTFPALTLAWLYIEPSPCGGVRPAGDPVDSDPRAVFEDDLHPRSDAGRPLEPWLCHHTREHFTWMLTVFTSLACYPGATPYCHRNTAGCWAGMGGACRFPVPRGDH